MSAVDLERNALNSLEKNQLIDVILNLKGELTKMTNDLMKITNLRL